MKRRLVVRLLARLEASPLRRTDPVWLDLERELIELMTAEGRAIISCMKKPVSGPDELRKAARLIGMCRESFNQRFTAEELLKLARACWASEWDFTPDQWTEEQVQAALKGEVPRWNDDESPAAPRTVAN
jgi:hypothetical protein